jgi:cell division protein FtsZ
LGIGIFLDFKQGGGQMIEFDLLEEKKDSDQLGKASIKVIGVGGAGGNTINSMIDNGTESEIEFVVANTDSQALALSKAKHKVQLGIKSTKGLGTGANPEVGMRAAEEDIDKLLEIVGDADIVFLAAGMGGGTGSGASPVIARALRERNILTIAVVTKPFIFEGRRRARIAQDAVEDLRAEVDTLLIVPNQKLLEVAELGVSMIDAFAMVNDVLDQSVRGISNIIIKPGHINVDFADLSAIMRDMGLAVMGTGKSSGENRAREAAMSAISSPLLENMSIKGAKGVLLNITGGKDLGLHEINEAASVVYEQADEDANIILGSVIDESMGDEIIVTIVATGFDEVRREAVVQDSMQVPEKTVAAVQEPVAPIASEPQLEKEIKVVFEKKEEVVETKVTTKNELLDMNDLDVPTFLRDKLKENQS